MGVNETTNRLKTTLCGWTLDNPIMNASGTYGMGYELTPWVDPNQMGALVLKGTSNEPRKGNPTPRIAESFSGMLNAVGLENPGLDVMINEKLPRLAQDYHKKLVANIVGNSVADYVTVSKAFDAVDEVALLELNISCPNTEKGGMEFGLDAGMAAEVVAAVKEQTRKPVFAKLTPNVTNIVEIAQAVEHAGADGVTLINTVKGMRINMKKRAPLLGIKTGGCSGPAIFPIAIRMIYEVYAATALPIIGAGGVHDAASALEMLMAGASAIQIGAAGLRDPGAWIKTIRSLEEQLDRYGIASVKAAIGLAHGTNRRSNEWDA